MSIPPLPKGLADSRSSRVANALHSIAIHLLRRARVADRGSGLSPERLSVLSVLAFAGPRTAGELAETEMVSPPAITRITTALEQLGLIRRESGTQDRRQVVLHATPRGRRLVELGRRRRIETIVAELDGLGPDDLAVLERAVELLAQLDATRDAGSRSRSR